MLSWGRVRRALQPIVFKYWIHRRAQRSVVTRMLGLELEIFPGVFHPKYFGSSAILAKFVSSLPLAGKSFLEIGCGSGVVSICAARAGALVAAADINPEAVRCTKANARKNGVQLDAFESDLFSALPASRYDLIAWNPPFLPGVPQSAADAAFYGGPRFEVIRRFVCEARDHIHGNASIYTILSTDIDIRAIEQIFRDQNFNVSQFLSKRWGLGETMVILCAQ
jgi:release factor glutamine methyltransferase